MEGYRLLSVRARGFRGFPEDAGWQEFHFDAPCTLIYGVQGGGKSSTLGSIGWCLFGNQVATKGSTGIQERKNWLVTNRHSREARVELVFAHGDDRLSVVRSSRKKRTEPSFFYQINSGKMQTNEQQLHRILGLEFADYMSCVHLHQELISGLLVQEPRDRKTALDRMLGLADLRNFIEGLKRSKIPQKLRESQGKFEQAGQRLATKLEMRRADLIEAKRDAKMAGIRDTSLEGVQTYCKELFDALRPLAGEAIEDDDFPKVTAIEDTQDLEDFLDSAKESIRLIRAEQPALAQEQSLLQQKSQLAQYQSDLELRYRFLRDLLQEVDTFSQEHGDATAITLKQDALEKEIEGLQEEKRRADRRGSLLIETLQFLRNSHEDELEECPVCGSSSFEAQEIQSKLEQWQEEIQGTLGPLENRQEELEKQKAQLQQFVEKAKGLERKLAKTEERVVSGLVTFRSEREQEEELLKRLSEFSTEELEQNPLDCVKNYLDEVVAYQQEIQTRLESITEAVAQGHEALHTQEDRLESLNQVRAVWSLREEVDELLSLKEDETYLELVGTHDNIKAYARDIRILQSASERVLAASANQKLDATREAISNIYRQLSGREDFPDIEIDPVKYEVMAVRGNEREVALRFLNKGDINCAALSIFLALASSSVATHRFGFILLDDPTQHLDLEHKKKLVGVLSQILKDKQLVIATAENDFLSLLCDRLETEKKIYAIENWDDNSGPQWRVDSW
mgnify:CR=1 FL=1